MPKPLTLQDFMTTSSTHESWTASPETPMTSQEIGAFCSVPCECPASENVHAERGCGSSLGLVRGDPMCEVWRGSQDLAANGESQSGEMGGITCNSHNSYNQGADALGARVAMGVPTDGPQPGEAVSAAATHQQHYLEPTHLCQITCETNLGVEFYAKAGAICVGAWQRPLKQQSRFTTRRRQTCSMTSCSMEDNFNGG